MEFPLKEIKEIQKIKDDEDHVARLSIQQFGSIVKYTEEMKHNLKHFSEIIENWYSQILGEMRTEDKFLNWLLIKGKMWLRNLFKSL